jgi:hypothetical protein
MKRTRKESTGFSGWFLTFLAVPFLLWWYPFFARHDHTFFLFLSFSGRVGSIEARRFAVVFLGETNFRLRISRIGGRIVLGMDELFARSVHLLLPVVGRDLFFFLDHSFWLLLASRCLPIMCNHYSLSEFWGFFPVQAFLRAMLLCIGQDWTCHYFLLHVCM